MKPPPTLADFQTHFEGVEHTLRAKLQTVRAQLHQGGNKGASAEAAFREALSRFLPRRLTIGHGEIIDTYGARSAQCDLVVATDHHPNWVRVDEPALFLIEGVAAGAEIKALLTTDHLAASIQNCGRFRQLRPRWGGQAEVLGSDEDIQRFYRNPPYFVFAYESQLTIETIAERVAATHNIADGRRGEAIDGVFVLDRGYVLNFGYGRSAFVAQDGEGERLKGFFHDDQEPPLLALMRWLPLVLAAPMSQLPILSQYLLPDTPSQLKEPPA